MMFVCASGFFCSDMSTITGDILSLTDGKDNTNYLKSAG